MKVLIVGGGGREHALAWKLRQDDPACEIIAAPGNPGIARLGRCVDIAATNIPALITLARTERVDFTLVGPEGPLEAGIVDRFRGDGLAIFGPTASAARVETSKRFAKELMQAAGVPTASARTFTEPGAAKAEAQGRIDRVLKVKGKRTVREFHRAIGTLCWDHVGMARTEAGLTGAIAQIRQLREEFWQDVAVPGDTNNLNPGLDYAGRVADYMEFAEVLALDALERRESCGGHFREEFQTPDGEALRKDDDYSYVAAWEFKGVGARPALHKEALMFEEVRPTQRSYK